jgi:hypothetical protein
MPPMLYQPTFLSPKGEVYGSPTGDSKKILAGCRMQCPMRILCLVVNRETQGESNYNMDNSAF